VPDAEVRTLAKRRQFNAAYKLSVLEEADRCTSSGAIGALLCQRNSNLDTPRLRVGN
jgi:hypothetical protein